VNEKVGVVVGSMHGENILFHLPAFAYGFKTSSYIRYL